MTFRNRQDAGQQLADRLSWLAESEKLLVLGLPRGGVPVAREVAEALKAELDVFVVRKLGTPGQPELALGAVASGGVRVLNRQITEALQVSQGQIDDITRGELQKLERQEMQFRGDRPPAEVAGRDVIVVDDGLATGATMHAACQALRRREPRQVIVAVPTAPRDAVDRLTEVADHVVSVMIPTDFAGVGAWYQDFSQVSDREVRRLLEEAA